MAGGIGHLECIPAFVVLHFEDLGEVAIADLAVVVNQSLFLVVYPYSNRLILGIGHRQKILAILVDKLAYVNALQFMSRFVSDILLVARAVINNLNSVSSGSKALEVHRANKTVQTCNGLRVNGISALIEDIQFYLSGVASFIDHLKYLGALERHYSHARLVITEGERRCTHCYKKSKK